MSRKFVPQPVSWTQVFLSCSGEGGLVEPLGFGLPGAEKTVLFHQPLAVVGVHKETDRRSHLLKILEHPAINNLLLEGPDEAFGHAVGFGLFDKGETGVNAPVFQIVSALSG